MAVNLPPRYAEGHYSGRVNYVKKGCVCARARDLIDNVAGVRIKRVQR